MQALPTAPLNVIEATRSLAIFIELLDRPPPMCQNHEGHRRAKRVSAGKRAKNHVGSPSSPAEGVPRAVSPLLLCSLSNCVRDSHCGKINIAYKCRIAVSYRNHTLSYVKRHHGKPRIETLYIATMPFHNLSTRSTISTNTMSISASRSHNNPFRLFSHLFVHSVPHLQGEHVRVALRVLWIRKYRGYTFLSWRLASIAKREKSYLYTRRKK